MNAIARLKKSNKFNMKIYTKDEISRAYFILEGITGIGQFSLTTGAFLAGFVSFLGGSESLNGSLGVVPSAAGIFQLLSSLMIREGQTRKSLVLKWGILLRLLLSSVYFIPYLVMWTGASDSIILWSFVLCFVAAFIINGLIAPYISGWLIDLTPMNIRGKYLALRERVSLVIIAGSTIGLGKVLDHNKSMGHEFQGFLIVGLVLALMGLLNIYALYKIEDVDHEEVKSQESLTKRLIKPLRDKIFRNVIYFNLIWNFALFVGGPYIAVYMVEDLRLSYTYMMSMTVLGTIIRVSCSGLWGRLADRKSWLSSGRFSLLVLGVAHFSWSFVTLDNAYILIPMLNIIGGIAWAGLAMSIFTIQFLYVDKKIRTISLGVNAALGGIVGLMAVKLGGFMIKLFNVQVVFIMSGISLILCSLYIVVVLSKTKARNV